jgi:hypothetical protein
VQQNIRQEESRIFYMCNRTLDRRKAEYYTCKTEHETGGKHNIIHVKQNIRLEESRILYTENRTLDRRKAEYYTCKTEH